MDSTFMHYATTTLRVYVASNILITCFIAWTSPESLTSRAILGGEPIGKFFLAISIFLAVVAILDSIVNESAIIPFSSYLTKRWRQLGFMLLAVSSASTGFLVIANSGYHPVLARYMTDSLASVVVAILGLRELYRSSQADVA